MKHDEASCTLLIPVGISPLLWQELPVYDCKASTYGW
jgi:hypothetical protein